MSHQPPHQMAGSAPTSEPTSSAQTTATTETTATPATTATTRATPATTTTTVAHSPPSAPLTRLAPSAIVAAPVVSAPSDARAGQMVRLVGQGFSPGSKVRIVFLSSRKHVVVGSTVAQPDGSFAMSLVVPRAKPGEHKLQVVGTSSSGQSGSWAAPVMVLADVSSPASDTPSLATPVLVGLSIAFPLLTWLVLDLLAWRNRRLGRDARSA